MRVIIAGSRNITDYVLVKSCISKVLKAHPEIQITEVVSGESSGVDKLGALWADNSGIPVKSFPANWQDFSEPCRTKTRKDGTKYNALAGFKRNLQMAAYGNILIAIWDGHSSGTKHMLDAATKAGLKVIKIII